MANYLLIRLIINVGFPNNISIISTCSLSSSCILPPNLPRQLTNKKYTKLHARSLSLSSVTNDDMIGVFPGFLWQHAWNEATKYSCHPWQCHDSASVCHANLWHATPRRRDIDGRCDASIYTTRSLPYKWVEFRCQVTWDRYRLRSLVKLLMTGFFVRLDLMLWFIISLW